MAPLFLLPVCLGDIRELNPLKMRLKDLSGNVREHLICTDVNDAHAQEQKVIFCQNLYIA